MTLSTFNDLLIRIKLATIRTKLATDIDATPIKLILSLWAAWPVWIAQTPKHNPRKAMPVRNITSGEVPPSRISMHSDPIQHKAPTKRDRAHSLIFAEQIDIFIAKEDCPPG